MTGRRDIPEPPGALAPQGDPRAEVVARLPVTERRLHLAGVDTAVLEGGDGPPVVVLHGIGQFAATWTRVIPALTATHRVVIPDLPGQGASRVVEGRLDAEQVLDWLDELVQHTCSEAPALVGHQAGGAMAARFAADHGDRVSHLVLVDSFGLAPFRPAPGFALAMIGFMVRPTPHTRDRFLGHCMADLGAVHDQMGREWELLAAAALEGARTPSVKVAGRRLMKAFGVPAIPEGDLARIAVPTTLVWGRLDTETRLSVAEAASARHGWPLRVVEDCGADPNIEQPEALLAALGEALTSR